MFDRSAASGSEASLRGLIAYGFTPHVTVSFTAPVVFGSASLTPTRIQAGDDFDAKVAWRFQHRATKVGTRFESTAFVGLAAPGPQSGFAGIARTSNARKYVWRGDGDGVAQQLRLVRQHVYKIYERNGDRRPDVLDYSLVYGYRPLKWRRPDKWDWRLFGELVGERSGRFVKGALLFPNPRRIRFLLGLPRWESIATIPSVLGCSFRSIAMLARCFPKERVGSRLISATCCFSIPRRIL